MGEKLDWTQTEDDRLKTWGWATPDEEILDWSVRHQKPLMAIYTRISHILRTEMPKVLSEYQTCMYKARRAQGESGAMYYSVGTVVSLFKPASLKENSREALCLWAPGATDDYLKSQGIRRVRSGLTFWYDAENVAALYRRLVGSEPRPGYIPGKQRKLKDVAQERPASALATVPVTTPVPATAPSPLLTLAEKVTALYREGRLTEEEATLLLFPLFKNKVASFEK